jgi:hypothetical protein
VNWRTLFGNSRELMSAIQSLSPKFLGLISTKQTARYSEISGKQLELLKEIVPRLSRVAVLASSTTPGNAQQLKETEIAARALGVQLHFLDVLSSKTIETAFRAASNERADAVLVLQSPVFVNERTQLAKLAVRAGCQRYTTGENLWTMVALYATGQISPTCPTALPRT